MYRVGGDWPMHWFERRDDVEDVPESVQRLREGGRCGGDTSSHCMR